MLHDRDMPYYLWTKEYSAIVYIQNRDPHKVLGKMTAKDVGHFKIFWSLAYCHIPRDTHTKLDQAVERGYFVGYNETSKAYSIFIPMTKKIIFIHDFKFMEDKAFRRSKDFPAND